MNYDINSFFDDLENYNIDFVVLRDLNNALPNNLSEEKDVDIMIKNTDINKFHSLVKKRKLKRIKHPWDFGRNFVFLYNMNEFEMYKIDRINIDICFELPVRSLNNREWMPLDDYIYQSIWKTKKKHDSYYILGDTELLVHLISRSLLDKNEFSKIYIAKIESLFTNVDKDELNRMLSLVFFKFTNKLIELLSKKKYSVIYKEYLTFSEY